MNIKLNNISSLDLFRGIAAYGLAICHFYYYLYNLNNFQFYSIFFVEFFFVLSGFVLTPQLQRIYNNTKDTKIFYFSSTQFDCIASALVDKTIHQSTLIN